ncbi:MAG TPA: sulfurtransferase [Anaerolineae bacterium]|nr:sulfurtransferase [Anaerolineae bacterium]
MSEKRFANEQLLVSPEWLESHLDDPDVRVVEVTTPGAGYAIGHIRGAVFFDPIQASSASALDAQQIAAQLGSLGLSPDKHIIVYDEIGGDRASQMFWLLEYLGFDRVSLLEGGVERWLAEGHRQTRLPPKIEPTTFTPNLREERIANADWIASRLEGNQMILVDCRTEEEFIEGHIPGAGNRNWERNLILRAYQQFRDADELKKEFAALGATDGREIVTYCGSGKRSSHSYFTLRLLGYPSVRNYKGSWDDWQTRADLPKAAGK